MAKPEKTISDPRENEARESTPQAVVRILADLVDDLSRQPIPLHAETDLEDDLGLGSLERVELLSRLERRFGATLPKDLLTEDQTVASLLDSVTRSVDGRAAPLPPSVAEAPPAPAIEVASPVETGNGQGRGSRVYGAYAAVSFLLGMASTTLAAMPFCKTAPRAWSVSRRALRIGFTAARLAPRRSGLPWPRDPAVLVSNHASILDPLILIAICERPIAFTSKVQVFSYPIFGHYMGMMNLIQVRRSTVERRLETYDKMVEAARNGSHVHIFPEATYTAATGIRPFRLGAFQLAAEHNLPIVPVAVRGTRHVMGEGAGLPRHGPIEVRVLETLPPPEPRFRSMVDRRDAAREVIAQAVGEPVLDIRSARMPATTDLDE